LVTPAIATDWLADDINECNRRLKVLHIETMARDIADGNWDEDLGAPIRFDWFGKMRDGQNRLAAVVMAKKAVRFTVIRGLDPASIKNVDTGAPRRFNDLLTMDGETSARNLAAVTRRAFLWRKGFKVGTGGGIMVPSHGELTTFLAENKELRFASIRGRDIYMHKKDRLMPAALGGFAYWLCAQKSYDDTESFWGKFMTRAHMEEYHPVQTLRRRLETATRLEKRLKPAEILALTFRAWNYYRDDETAERLQITRGGLTDANMPEPR
jgi:hypothetical protein